MSQANQVMAAPGEPAAVPSQEHLVKGIEPQGKRETPAEAGAKSVPQGHRRTSIGPSPAYLSWPEPLTVSMGILLTKRDTFFNEQAPKQKPAAPSGLSSRHRIYSRTKCRHHTCRATEGPLERIGGGAVCPHCGRALGTLTSLCSTPTPHCQHCTVCKTQVSLCP